MTGLTPSLTYRLYATAVNAIGESDKSNEVLFSAASLPSKPAQIYRHQSTTRDVLVIAWNVEPDNDLPVTGYSIEADLTCTGDFVEIWDGRDRPEVLKLIVPDTEPAVPYTFRHRAFNFNGASEYSDELTTFACVDPSPPSKPRWVRSTETSITIEWDGSADDGGCPVIDYRVFRDSGLVLGETDVVYEVHTELLTDKTHIATLEVTDFPTNSLGNYF